MPSRCLFFAFVPSSPPSRGVWFFCNLTFSQWFFHATQGSQCRNTKNFHSTRGDLVWWLLRCCFGGCVARKLLDSTTCCLCLKVGAWRLFCGFFFFLHSSMSTQSCCYEWGLEPQEEKKNCTENFILSWDEILWLKSKLCKEKKLTINRCNLVNNVEISSIKLTLKRLNL